MGKRVFKLLVAFARSLVFWKARTWLISSGVFGVPGIMLMSYMPLLAGVLGGTAILLAAVGLLTSQRRREEFLGRIFPARAIKFQSVRIDEETVNGKKFFRLRAVFCNLGSKPIVKVGARLKVFRSFIRHQIVLDKSDYVEGVWCSKRGTDHLNFVDFQPNGLTWILEIATKPAEEAFCSLVDCGQLNGGRQLYAYHDPLLVGVVLSGEDYMPSSFWFLVRANFSNEIPRITFLSDEELNEIQVRQEANEERIRGDVV